MRSPVIFVSLLCACLSTLPRAEAQRLIPFKLPDTGQEKRFTTSGGEDADYTINPLSYTDNGDGTLTDNNTGLMWQKTDGGEMTIDSARRYAAALALGGYSDWRLPTNHELFSIAKHDSVNPAISKGYFTKTVAEYWWTSEARADDATKVWAVNAGGGTGAHPVSETVSAGGAKKFHARAVRDPYTTTFSVAHFRDNADGTVTDQYTGLTWQKLQATGLTWEQALTFADSLTLGGRSDWRLPNIKEIQSLNDETRSKPSFNKTFFTNVASGNYWSSTTLVQASTKAWDINIDYGIVSYTDKTTPENVLCVRGGLDNHTLNITEAVIPGGTYQMGDHFGYVDPRHPSDETPVHTVTVDSFVIGTTVVTNAQYLAYLNDALHRGAIEVRNNIVYAVGGSDIYCYTHQYAPYYSIGYDGQVFSMADFRANHPMVGVMWGGAAAFCNWLSAQNGLDACYNLTTWACDFTKSGYRLPSEAEWEWAARGGHTSPYFNYVWGNTPNASQANWPSSGDPYESTDSTRYPCTTPVGFYNGALHAKTEYDWPSSAASYQTVDGVNAFGLYDMAGNVWQFVNDWYAANYYSNSPAVNPHGPDTGSVMPDGKRYRGMRGGNWYNGDMVSGVDDGHSRVSNRNPSYFRGPQDPNHPWYHIGFRVARNTAGGLVAVSNTGDAAPQDYTLYQNYPNPFNPSTTIRFALPRATHVTMRVYNALGQCLATLIDQPMAAGTYERAFRADGMGSGVMYCEMRAGGTRQTQRMLLLK